MIDKNINDTEKLKKELQLSLGMYDLDAKSAELNHVLKVTDTLVDTLITAMKSHNFEQFYNDLDELQIIVASAFNGRLNNKFADKKTELVGSIKWAYLLLNENADADTNDLNSITTIFNDLFKLIHENVTHLNHSIALYHYFFN